MHLGSHKAKRSRAYSQATNNGAICPERERMKGVKLNPQEVKSGQKDRIRLLNVVTSSLSAVLMRGQLLYLSERNFEVYLASAPGPNLRAAAAKEGVTAIEVPMAREISLFSDCISLVRLCVLMKRIRPVITNVSTPKAGLLGGLAALITRVPCRVYTVRGLRWETLHGLKRKILLLAEWIACRCAHRVICVSQSVLDKIVAAGLARSGCALILGSGSSNGIDSERFKPTPESERQARDLREMLNIPTDAPVVGYAGRLTRDKGIAELYEAHSILRNEFPSLRLLLVGDYESGDPLPPTLRQSLESDSTVVRLGPVPDMSAFYQIFDVLAFPSHREGFPNVVLEAQAAGKPVISTRATGTVDAVVDGVTGMLVPVADVEALVAGLRALLCDSSLRAKMGAAGRRRAISEFDQERIWRRLAEEYMDLLQIKGLLSPVVETVGVPAVVADSALTPRDGCPKSLEEGGIR